MPEHAHDHRSPKVEIDAAADELMKKRMRQNVKMQRYRKRLVERADILRAEVAHLEADIDAYVVHQQERLRAAPKALPWKEVARAMQEDLDLTKKDNLALRRLCDSQAAISLAMKRWVASSVSLLTSPSGNTVLSWRHVTIGTDPASRVRAFDWITRHLYHNTDYMLQQYLFPSASSSEIVNDYIVDVSNAHGLQYIRRHQISVPYSLEAVRDYFARPYCAHMGGSAFPPSNLANSAAVIAADDQMLRYYDGKLEYAHCSKAGGRALVHTLVREFNDPNRAVFVMQNVHDDALLPNDAIQRNRMRWVVLERISPNETKIRMLAIMSRRFSKHGFVPLVEEALEWGLDVRASMVDSLLEDATERRVNHHIYQICKSEPSCARDVDEALAGKSVC
ncbi:Aste57867_18912 [Aphanomyces stellatus]|uniref:Aste57867_18912 protein n=1 Tax=Aphanomyces stellatus TaxID=120398 RepID=A0A485LCS6_9STRA|nr:hypothetical protein As57867_018848 [Aphanomyces stellatus]VFT95644.1 Aste57867_18912 [Aphanomyces stellatus]